MSNRNQQGNRGQMPAPPASPQPSVNPESLLAPQEPVAPEVAPEAEEVAVADAPVTVVAVRAGFFDKKRIKEGEHFRIPSMKMFGSWMKLADPVAEKKRQEQLKKAKAGK